MSAVCPSCGVAVVPGYVKCPKCQTPLPLRRAQTAAAGGTALDEGGVPLIPILLGVAAVGIVIAVFALRGGDDESTPAPAEAAAAGAEPDDDDDDPTPSEVDVSPAPAPAAPPAADPMIAIRSLDRALAKQRLWGTVETVGAGIDVRSGSCRDPAMMPILDAAIPALRDGGVTKIRCLEQGGAVVFERDL